jgi:hypothetical protein
MERDSLRCLSIFPKCWRGKLSLHTPLHWNVQAVGLCCAVFAAARRFIGQPAPAGGAAKLLHAYARRQWRASGNRGCNLLHPLVHSPGCACTARVPGAYAPRLPSAHLRASCRARASWTTAAIAPAPPHNARRRRDHAAYPQPARARCARPAPAHAPRRPHSSLGAACCEHLPALRP